MTNDDENDYQPIDAEALRPGMKVKIDGRKHPLDVTTTDPRYGIVGLVGPQGGEYVIENRDDLYYVLKNTWSGNTEVVNSLEAAYPAGETRAGPDEPPHEFMSYDDMRKSIDDADFPETSGETVTYELPVEYAAYLGPYMIVSSEFFGRFGVDGSGPMAEYLHSVFMEGLETADGLDGESFQRFMGYTQRVIEHFEDIDDMDAHLHGDRDVSVAAITGNRDDVPAEVADWLDSITDDRGRAAIDSMELANAPDAVLDYLEAEEILPDGMIDMLRDMKGDNDLARDSIDRMFQ